MLFNTSQKTNTAGILENTSFRMPYIIDKKRRRKKQFAEGIIRVYRTPSEWSDDEYKYWWLPQTDGKGKILRSARLSLKDKEQYLEADGHNAIMNQGRTQVLTYMGSPSGSAVQWAQYFAIGTGAITATSPVDTSLANEIFRKQPATFSVTGTQVDINIQLASTDAQASFTNCGIFGNSASSTLGSGSLLTHALFSFTKGNFAVAVDYVINIL